MTQRNKDEIRVLVVDDEPGMRDMLSFELSAQGYKILTAGDGLEAVEIVRTQPVDLVISDIKMPKMDGVSALEEIKKINPGIEVIMATGFGTIETAVTAMKKGAYDFIQKPYNLDEISMLVEKALEKNELRTLIALYESSRAIFSAVKLDDLLSLVMDLIHKGLRADEGSLMFLNDAGELYIASSKGIQEDAARRVNIKIGERIAGRVAQDRKAMLLVGGLEKYSEFKGVESNPRIASSIVIPLVHQNELFGVLTLNRVQGHENFTSADLRHASIFASQVAQAVCNAKLFQALEKKVDELKSAYQTLEETQAELIGAEKLAAIGRLVSGVAHEINNPLTSVLGYTELLLTSDVPDGMKQDLETVFHEAQRCRKIVQDLLIFARRQKPSFELAHMDQLIDRTIESISIELNKNSVQIVKHFSDCPAIYADPLQMQQVFLNILTNANQVLQNNSGEKKIEISVSLHTEKMLRVVFKDNGPGIAPEHLDKVFEPFFTTKDIGKGTGLGLSISHGIVQRHGGCILVESVKGQGAAFIIDLPALDEKEGRILATVSAMAAAPRRAASASKTILVVEDEEPIRTFLKRLLAAKGFRVETAENGEAALAVLAKEEFDLILCDMLMPKMNGMQLFEKLKAMKPALAENFIFVSGCSADKAFDEFLKANNLTRLTKPFVPDQLVDFVVEKLSSKR